jgi:hypothetical protein
LQRTGSDILYFYKDLFASLCFIFFGAALAFHHAYLYFGAMMCGCLSTTAHRKKWPDPIWAKLYIDDFNEWFDSWIEGKTQKKEFSDGQDINPLPPLDK